MSLPLRYTPQILGLLVRAGLAEARAGQNGGYRLTRAPAEISLLQLLEAAEETLRPERCTLSGGPCHWEDMCPLHSTWDDARQALMDVLEKRTLADVIAVDASLEAKTERIPPDAHRAQHRGAAGSTRRRSSS